LYSSSERWAPAPAPAATTTSFFFPTNRFTASGVSATRASPGALSLQTAIFMRRGVSQARSAPSTPWYEVGDAHILRPPARPADALLHGDVGALLVLRHARHPDPLHGGRAGGRRPGLLGCKGRNDLRHLHRDGLPRVAARRLDRRPLPRPAPGGPLRRRAHHDGPHLPGDPHPHHLLYW